MKSAFLGKIQFVATREQTYRIETTLIKMIEVRLLVRLFFWFSPYSLAAFYFAALTITATYIYIYVCRCDLKFVQR